MAYPQGTRIGVWGFTATLSSFSLVFLILNILQKINIPITNATYEKILLISTLFGLIIGIIFGWIYDNKFELLKKNATNREIKKIYNKEVFYLSIINFTAMIILYINCYISLR